MNDKERIVKLRVDVGRRVKELRENLNLSRVDLADLMGISEYFLIEIELGRRGFSYITLCKAADVLCTTTDYLLTGRESVSDIRSITALLEQIDEPLLKGAERLLKEYINSIHYIESKVEQKDK